MIEANVDALVGPSHHYGGLGVGNIASLEHAQQPSSPRKGALQGLEKAELVSSLGIPQFFLLPPPRPYRSWLTRLGFQGDFDEQCCQAFHQSPQALSACFSSSFMWAANSATVAPSSDATDQCLHFTPANLNSSWHRGLEAEARSQDFREIFGQIPNCRIHQSLPNLVPLREEGAANHMRLCGQGGHAAIHVFVHGEGDSGRVPTRYLPRQTHAASQAVARLNGLPEQDVFFLQQHPEAISAGAFHNDVIATSHEDLLLYHECAFANAESKLERIAKRFHSKTGTTLKCIRVSQQQLSLAEAVESYFFNSQILTPNREAGQDQPRMVLICPEQCRQVDRARLLVESILADAENPIEEVTLCCTRPEHGRRRRTSLFATACFSIRQRTSLRQSGFSDHGSELGSPAEYHRTRVS